MAKALARARYIRVSPRKMRLVADMVRGKRVEEAAAVLEYKRRRASKILADLLASAVANAEDAATRQHQRIDTDEMVISRLVVDEGPIVYRLRPQPRGRATRIRKRTAHVEICISDEEES